METKKFELSKELKQIAEQINTGAIKNYFTLDGKADWFDNSLLGDIMEVTSASDNDNIKKTLREFTFLIDKDKRLVVLLAIKDLYSLEKGFSDEYLTPDEQYSQYMSDCAARIIYREMQFWKLAEGYDIDKINQASKTTTDPADLPF